MFTKPIVAAAALVLAVAAKPIPAFKDIISKRHQSFNNYGGFSSMSHFDDFYGSDDFSGSSQKLVTEKHVVCHSEQIEIVQQQLAVIREYYKKIITQQICEVEVQTIVHSQFVSGCESFSDDLRRHGSHRSVSYDSNISSQINVIHDSNNECVTNDLGWQGTCIGEHAVSISGDNWGDSGVSSSVESAYGQCESASGFSSPSYSSSWSSSYSPPSIYSPSYSYVAPSSDSYTYVAPDNSYTYIAPPSYYSYEAPSYTDIAPPTVTDVSSYGYGSSGYEAPSYGSSYAPPSSDSSYVPPSSDSSYVPPSDSSSECDSCGPAPLVSGTPVPVSGNSTDVTPTDATDAPVATDASTDATDATDAPTATDATDASATDATDASAATDTTDASATDATDSAAAAPTATARK